MSIASPSDRRAPHEVGRAARLELRFGCRAGRTVLEHGYAEPPLRVGKCLDAGDRLHLVLASSAPGIFGGDRFDQSIAVASGARVQLASQSSLQVHPDREGMPAAVFSRFHVESGASLACEWHPTIPFAGARLRQRIAIDIEAGAALVWSDALMCGREARGERWQFSSLDHELRVTVGGTLRYLERYSLAPSPQRGARRWAEADSNYFGSVVVAGDVAASAASLHEEVSRIDGLCAAADRLDDQVLLIRLMAVAGAPFHHARAWLARRLTASD